MQDAGFLAYFHMNGEKPIDLSIVRSRLLPGTTQVCQNSAASQTPNLRTLMPSVQLLCHSACHTMGIAHTGQFRWTFRHALQRDMLRGMEGEK